MTTTQEKLENIMNMDELFQKIQNAVFVTTLQPINYDVKYLHDDLLFVPDLQEITNIFHSLDDLRNSIILTSRDGTNIEIKSDDRADREYPIRFVVDGKNYEIISERFTDSGEDELREMIENTEEKNYPENEAREMNDTKIEAHNIPIYIKEHLVEIVNGYASTLEELQDADPDSENFPATLYDMPFTGKLDTGETVEVFQAEESINHDGGEIAVVVKINDRYFIDHGTHSSWDSNYFNNDFQEVERVEVPVIKIEYKPI